MSYINKEKGFTLIELIIVILLLSIFLTFSVPHFKTDLLQNNTGTTCRWIVKKINVLRKTAINNQKTYTLHVGIDSNRMWVTDESMSEDVMENMEQKRIRNPC